MYIAYFSFQDNIKKQKKRSRSRETRYSRRRRSRRSQDNLPEHTGPHSSGADPKTPEDPANLRLLCPSGAQHAKGRKERK